MKRFHNTFALVVFLVAFNCTPKDERKAINIRKPDENRFTPVTLTPEGALDEPMMFEVADKKNGLHY